MNQKQFEEKWQGRLKEVKNIKRLPRFLRKMLKDADDYGSIAVALGYGSVACAWAMNKHKNGGITGFQAGFVMWTFIREWEHKHNKTGLRILDYDNMLFPTYEDRFEKTITKSMWESLQEMAKKKLEEKEEHVAPRVINHWQSIVDGTVPFGYTVKED
jgi:hypothetical protein